MSGFTNKAKHNSGILWFLAASLGKFYKNNLEKIRQIHKTPVSKANSRSSV